MSSNEHHENNKHRSKNRSHRRRGNKHNNKDHHDEVSSNNNTNTTTSCDDHHSVSTISDNEHHHHQQQQQSTVQPTATESPIVQVQVEEEEQEATKTPSAPVSVVRVPSSNSSTEEVHDDNTAVRSMPPPSASVDTIHPQSPKKQQQQESSCSSECQVKRAIQWAQEKRLLKILLEVFILLRAVCFFAFAVCLSVALGVQRRVLVRFPKAKTYIDRIEAVVVPLLKSADGRLKVTKTVIPTVVSYSTKALDAVEKFAAECEAPDLGKLCAVVRRTPSDVEGEFRWTSSRA